MKAIVYLSLFSFLILTTSCKKEDLSIANEYALEIGQTVSFDKGAFEINFEEVNDSRCPINAFCAWPGEARVTFVLTENGKESVVVLIIPGLMDEADVSISNFGEYKIKLLEVNPYPNSFNPSPLKTVLFELIEL